MIKNKMGKIHIIEWKVRMTSHFGAVVSKVVDFG
jgi:hypothetical protein